MSVRNAHGRLPIRRLPPDSLAPTGVALSCPDDTRVPDDDSDESWDDFDPDEDLQPLDDPDLEIDDEPDPDERDFWLDPDESEDPWN